jgi:hypothetical protein
MVCGGTDTANPRGNLRHLLSGAPLGEFLKPTQLRNLKERPLHAPLLVKEDFDLPMALEASNGVNGDSPFHLLGFAFRHINSPHNYWDE